MARTRVWLAVTAAVAESAAIEHSAQVVPAGEVVALELADDLDTDQVADGGLDAVVAQAPVQDLGQAGVVAVGA